MAVNIIKTLIFFIVIFSLVGCAPYMTYQEMEDAFEIAETQEEKNALHKRIVTFEENWEKGILYFERKHACQADTATAWFCKNVHSISERKIKNEDVLVRAYKNEHLSCGCVNTKKFMSH